MKHLILMRHAKSSWTDDRLADRERPLSRRGERDAPRMAERARAHGVQTALILSSPAVRALRTAEALAAALGPTAALVVEPQLYLATASELLAVVARQPDTQSATALVGHNPGLTELTNRLLPDLALDNVPTAGVLCVELAAQRWADAARAPARLVFFDYPKNPAAPAQD